MELKIALEDLPVSVAPDASDPEVPYVILDVHGNPRCKCQSLEEAETLMHEINAARSETSPVGTPSAPDAVPNVVEATEGTPPQLPQNDIDATDGTHVETKRAQPKERAMPRGIPKKKRASGKKRAAKPAAKKTVRKTASVAKKRRKKRSPA